MSNNFEPTTDASVAAVAGGVAAAARSVLSDEFVNSGKSPVSGDKPADNTSPAAKAAQGVASGIAEALTQRSDSSSPAVKAALGAAAGIQEALTPQKRGDSNDRTPSPSLGQLLGDALKNGVNNDHRSEIPKVNEKGKIYDGGMDIIRNWDKTVTDKNRAEAKEALGKGLSELIPDADKALLKTMQGALIDGNLDKLKATLGSLSGDPERMEKFLKEINGQLKREGAGVELTNDGKGNVLVYEKHGNTAVSINAKTGETTLRAIERQNDGSMLLKPGEIINRKPSEVMKSIGDEATRGITGTHYRFSQYEFKGLPELQNRPRGGGGAVGEGIGNKIHSSAVDSLKSVEKLIQEKKVK